MAKEQAALDRKTRRMLVIIGICCAATVAVAFVMSARRPGRIPYSKPVWDSGRNDFTKTNPRLRMVEMIGQQIETSREAGKSLTKQQIKDMLGPSEPQVSVVDPKVGVAPAAYPTDDFVYILGVHPRSMMRERTIQVLHVVFAPNGHAEYTTTEEMDYPAGGKIVPAKLLAIPKPPKPTYVAPAKGPKKTGP